MKIYPKQEKSSREPGNYYFGNYWEIPVGVSFATIDENNKDEIKDKLHYHIKSDELYIVLDGEWILEIENQEVLLTPDSMVMIEPNEKHRIIKATKMPFRFIAISTTKDKNDKVVVEE